jgi:hypothetical protein
MKRKRRQWINYLHGKGFFSLSSLFKEYSEKLKSKEEKTENGFNSKIIYSFQKPTFTAFATLFNRGGRCRGAVSEKTLHKPTFTTWARIGRIHYNTGGKWVNQYTN